MKKITRTVNFTYAELSMITRAENGEIGFEVIDVRQFPGSLTEKEVNKKVRKLYPDDCIFVSKLETVNETREMSFDDFMNYSKKVN